MFKLPAGGSRKKGLPSKAKVQKQFNTSSKKIAAKRGVSVGVVKARRIAGGKTPATPPMKKSAAGTGVGTRAKPGPKTKKRAY